MEQREEPYGSLRDDDLPDDTSGDGTRGAEGGGGERFEDDSG
jgi:hypothetical protein